MMLAARHFHANSMNNTSFSSSSSPSSSSSSSSSSAWLHTQNHVNDMMERLKNGQASSIPKHVKILLSGSHDHANDHQNHPNNQARHLNLRTLGLFRALRHDKTVEKVSILFLGHLDLPMPQPTQQNMTTSSYWDAPTAKALAQAMAMAETDSGRKKSWHCAHTPLEFLPYLTKALLTEQQQPQKHHQNNHQNQTTELRISLHQSILRTRNEPCPIQQDLVQALIMTDQRQQQQQQYDSGWKRWQLSHFDLAQNDLRQLIQCKLTHLQLLDCGFHNNQNKHEKNRINASVSAGRRTDNTTQTLKHLNLSRNPQLTWANANGILSSVSGSALGNLERLSLSQCGLLTTKTNVSAAAAATVSSSLSSFQQEDCEQFIQALQRQAPCLTYLNVGSDVQNQQQRQQQHRHDNLGKHDKQLTICFLRALLNCLRHSNTSLRQVQWKGNEQQQPHQQQLRLPSGIGDDVKRQRLEQQVQYYLALNRAGRKELRTAVVVETGGCQTHTWPTENDNSADSKTTFPLGLVPQLLFRATRYSDDDDDTTSPQPATAQRLYGLLRLEAVPLLVPPRMDLSSSERRRKRQWL